MTKVAAFIFNLFQENTYVVYDETNECVIIDPGCYEAHEKVELMQFIQQNKLQPVRLLNTHCHIDHVFGNAFIASTYKLGLEIHEGEKAVLDLVPQVAKMYSIAYPEPSPAPSRYITDDELITFGNTTLQTLFTPGHSPASISFYCKKANFVIAGDVLFQNSIGRYDLPGGNLDTLMQSITHQLLTLDDQTIVYSGHGQSTTIGTEKKFNPFLQLNS